jgi:hypothetical protein
LLGPLILKDHANTKATIAYPLSHPFHILSSINFS